MRSLFFGLCLAVSLAACSSTDDGGEATGQDAGQSGSDVANVDTAEAAPIPCSEPGLIYVCDCWDDSESQQVCESDGFRSECDCPEICGVCTHDAELNLLGGWNECEGEVSGRLCFIQDGDAIIVAECVTPEQCDALE